MNRREWAKIVDEADEDVRMLRAHALLEQNRESTEFVILTLKATDLILSRLAILKHEILSGSGGYPKPSEEHND